MSKRIPTDRTCSRIPALLCGLLMITTLSAQIGCRSEEAIGSDLPTVIGGASATTAESSVTIDSDPIDSRHSDATRSEPASSAEPPTVESSPGSVVELDGGVRAWVGQGRVEFPGMVSLDQGWLEVAVCRRGTREHESIVVTDAIPSVVHAAMLLAGLESGAPASFDEETHRPIPPTGMRVSIELRFGAIDPETGEPILLSLAAAIEDARELVSPVWVFAGSLVRSNPPSMGPGEYYAADFAGTVVGLSTFGDEVVAVEEVRSPEAGIDPPVWRIRTGVLPEIDTPVTVVLKRSSHQE
ncbi:MAG: YdjY domain-containing protein [Planctomycetota bacterium]|nr:YdjY domain-containing protein [Planctomycetota bacterium]